MIAARTALATLAQAGQMLPKLILRVETASVWLHALVAAGLLSDVRVGREVLFANNDLLDVLTRPD